MTRAPAHESHREGSLVVRATADRLTVCPRHGPRATSLLGREPVADAEREARMAHTTPLRVTENARRRCARGDPGASFRCQLGWNTNQDTGQRHRPRQCCKAAFQCVGTESVDGGKPTASALCVGLLSSAEGLRDKADVPSARGTSAS